jgi:DNA polymerase (family 10)
MAQPSNAAVAAALREIRTLMEFAGEPFFKFMAYERAAETIDNAPPVATLVAEDRLRDLPGIGKSIAARVVEIVRTGTDPYLEELRSKYPSTLLELLGVQGVGMKTAQTLFTQLGIASLAQLEEALASGALSGMPRLGPKSLENMKRGVLAYKGRQKRTPIGRALPIALELIAYIGEGTVAEDLTYAGSLRRAEPTVGDIDLLCTADDAAPIIERFVAYPGAEAVLSEGSTKASIWLAGGLQVDLRVLSAPVFGNLLQHFTGSREHNIQLRELAVRKGLRVSENGIVDLKTGDTIRCRTEEEVYAALGLPYIAPELRLGIGEIDAARDGTLPKLVELADLRGDFHMHCTWSDGRNALEAMVAEAAARGYAYHSISDHSWGRGGWGLSPEDLRAQRERVRDLGEQYGIRTLCSSEVDILPDGSLDFPDEVLAQLDIVVASVHSAMNLSRDEMTARLIRACENPYVTIIGHPTGTALEIDGQPNRLDLPANLARRAREFGVTFTCDSDAHAREHLGNVAYAVGQARRAWLRAEDILNTRDLAGVLSFVEAKRTGPHARRPADPR